MDVIFTDVKHYFAEPETLKPPEPAGIVCTVCGSVFKSLLLLAIHKDKIHSNKTPGQGKNKRKKSLNSIISGCFGDMGPADSLGIISKFSDTSQSQSSSPVIVNNVESAETAKSSDSLSYKDTASSVRSDSPCCGNMINSNHGSDGSPLSGNYGNQDSPVTSEQGTPDGPTRAVSGSSSPTNVVLSHHCGACDESFVTRSALLSHQLCHKRGESYACKNCDKSFSLYDVYKMHVAKCTSQ